MRCDGEEEKREGTRVEAEQIERFEGVATSLLPLACSRRIYGPRSHATTRQGSNLEACGLAGRSGPLRLNSTPRNRSSAKAKEHCATVDDNNERLMSTLLPKRSQTDCHGCVRMDQRGVVVENGGPWSWRVVAVVQRRSIDLRVECLPASRTASLRRGVKSKTPGGRPSRSALLSC